MVKTGSPGLQGGWHQLLLQHVLPWGASASGAALSPLQGGTGRRRSLSPPGPALCPEGQPPAQQPSSFILQLLAGRALLCPGLRSQLPGGGSPAHLVTSAWPGPCPTQLCRSHGGCGLPVETALMAWEGWDPPRTCSLFNI